MHNTLSIIFILLWTCISILVIALLMVLVHNIYYKILWKNSEVYRELEDIKVDLRNNLHSFAYEKVWLNTSAKFKTFNFEKYILDKASNDKDWADDTLKSIRENHNLLNKAYDKVARLKNIDLENKSLREIQNKSINKFLKELDTKYDMEKSLNIVWRYTTPAGRYSYTDSRSVGLDLLTSLIDRSKELEKERQTKEYLNKQERNKVTPKIRYQVLQRDNYTCQYCGRTVSDGIKLHIDHIKPVSKGGKTELSNLITACQDCNLGKSDSYDESKTLNLER